MEEMSRKRQRWCRLCKRLSAQLTEDSCADFSVTSAFSYRIPTLGYIE